MKVFLTTTAAVLALAAPTWAASFSELDANGDGMVGILDILIVIADWGPCDGCAGDVNEDGVNNVLDIVTLVNWILYP